MIDHQDVVHLPVGRRIEDLQSYAAAVETGVVTRREGTVRKAPGGLVASQVTVTLEIEVGRMPTLGLTNRAATEFSGTRSGLAAQSAAACARSLRFLWVRH